MEPITRETFIRWATKGNWLLFGEGQTPQGRQHTYLTPSGSIVIITFDLKGNMFSVGQPVPAPQSLQGIIRGKG